MNNINVQPWQTRACSRLPLRVVLISHLGPQFIQTSGQHSLRNENWVEREPPVAGSPKSILACSPQIFVERRRDVRNKKLLDLHSSARKPLLIDIRNQRLERRPAPCK